MSGPLRTEDVADEQAAAVGSPALEITPGRETQVGATIVRRSLPTRLRRTVGAWCFLDHAPGRLAEPGSGMGIGPHPHVGLQTVTWLLAGEVVHTDSLGSEQLIRPGQLNLMTAGRGVAHAEESPATYRGGLHAVQLWVAQPEHTRHGDPAFEHHAELPRVDIGVSAATVIVGDLAGTASPARRDTDHFGADLTLRPRTTTVPVRSEHEHAVVVLEGSVRVAGQPVQPDHLVYLGLGRDAIELVADTASRALLLGGAPFETRPLMWWNFVARTHDEMDEAVAAWNSFDDRFGSPVGSSLPRIPAPTPPWHTR